MKTVAFIMAVIGMVMLTAGCAVNTMVDRSGKNGPVSYVDSLIRAGNDAAVDSLKNIIFGNYPSGLVRRALEGLGKIGSSYAVFTIGSFEADCESRVFMPLKFHFGENDPSRPLHQWWQTGQPLCICKDSGVFWALYPAVLYGRYGLWLSSSVDSTWWALPELVDTVTPSFTTSGLQTFSMVKTGTIFQFTSIRPNGFRADKFERSYDLLHIRRDSDNDDLPNWLERIYGTDSLNPDTNNDGINDGKDGNPLTEKIGIGDQPNDDIRQAIFYFLYGTRYGNEPVYLVGHGYFTWQEYTGYRGRVLRVDQEKLNCSNIVEFNVSADTMATKAQLVYHYPVKHGKAKSVYVSEYRFGLLKKFDKWFIDDYHLESQFTENYDSTGRKRDPVSTYFITDDKP